MSALAESTAKNSAANMPESMSEGVAESIAESIKVSGRFARSANLERDLARPEPLDGYVLTARGRDVVERIATVAASSSAGGAWSLTGPYGSGKSSLALLLDAAFGGQSKIRDTALQLVDSASASTADLIQRAHRRHGTDDKGFNRGLVTAAREPLTVTVARALHSAAHRDKSPPPPPRSFLTLHYEPASREARRTPELIRVS